jgi:hypothetical protein
MSIIGQRNLQGQPQWVQTDGLLVLPYRVWTTEKEATEKRRSVGKDGDRENESWESGS